MKSLLIPAGLALAAVAGIFPSAAPAVVWRAPQQALPRLLAAYGRPGSSG